MKLVKKFRLTLTPFAVLGGMFLLLSCKSSGEVYEYIKDFENREEIEHLVSNPTKELLLIGSFHFKRYFDVQPVIDQIVDFEADQLFGEVVPPGDYVESYRNFLYASSRRGNSYYTQMIDSTIRFTGIDKLKASGLVRANDDVVITDSGNSAEMVELANAFFVRNDESNGYLQMGYLRAHLDSAGYTNLSNQISPVHLQRTFILREVLHVLRPAAIELGIKRIDQMDYQRDRAVNDSLLNIISAKLIPRQFWRVWKIPYMIRMMNMDKNGPKDDEDAIRHFEILNRFDTYLNMAEVHEKYLYNPKMTPSMEWNRIYRKRNQKMVELIASSMTENGSNKAAVLVGASHIPYFIFEISKQMPDTKITLLDLDRLKKDKANYYKAK